jgi:hypothetical protein
MVASSVLEGIERARQERDEAEAELAGLIDRAVGLGIGWPKIATRLGVTRQAARQQYQRRRRDSASHQDRWHDSSATGACVKHQVALVNIRCQLLAIISGLP